MAEVYESVEYDVTPYADWKYAERLLLYPKEIVSFPSTIYGAQTHPLRRPSQQHCLSRLEARIFDKPELMTKITLSSSIIIKWLNIIIYCLNV